MVVVNANIEIQKLLKESGLFEGEIDGKIGKKTLAAIEIMLTMKGIDTSKWTKGRKLIAAEQVLYQSQGIEIGDIDGWNGDMFKHAQEVYKASLVTTWRDKSDEIEKINEKERLGPANYFSRIFTSILKMGQKKNLKNPIVIAFLGAAQNCLETGYGKSMVDHNAFGIKGEGPAGSINTWTTEIEDGKAVRMMQTFRAYNDIDEAMNDYLDLLATNPRYAKLFDAETVEEAIDIQGKSGYATSPDYGKTLLAIYKKYSWMAQELLDAEKTEEPPTETEPEPESALTLESIDPHQLAFIRGIGLTETALSKKEAYSEAYNQPSNNAMVRKYGDEGADYGYYQNNSIDVGEAIRDGMDAELANHLNGGGKGGKSTLAEQTLAMHVHLSMNYTDVYKALKKGTDKAFDEAMDAMDGHWFGLKDQPKLARKAWDLGDSDDLFEIFPEIFKKTKKVEPVAPVVVKPKTVWPKQSNVANYFGQPGENQVMCKVPFKLVLAWDKSNSLSSYSCNELVKDAMERIWQRTFDYYGYDKIVDLRLHYFGGCLNVRRIRGGSNWSMHAYGIAIDIDPDRNSLHTTWKNSQMSKPAYKQFVEFFYDEGFINLGKERDYDSMHFQAARLG